MKILLLPPLERNFHAVEREIEETRLRLKNTFEPKPRRELLRKLLLLIEEAEAITATT